MSSTQHQLIEQCATRLRGIVEALDNIHHTSPQRWLTDLDDVHSSAESLLALIKDQAPPSEDQLIAAGLSYPLAKEDAVKLWYAGFRSEVVTVLEAWEAIGHDIGMNPSKGELLDSLRNMAAICNAHGNDMPAQSAIDQRQVIADAITGALAFGAQASQPPAEDHWLRPFYDIGRAEGQRTQELAMLVRMLASALKRHAPDSNLVARATNYLAAKGLAGTPLRDAPASVEQAGGDERKLSDLGNELHNLSCSIVHENEEWAEQIGGIARELWNWPQARAALAQPSPAQAEQHWPKLEKPAQVGAIRFRAGLSSRLVVEAAQRLYEFESTPEKEAERIERLQAFREQCFEPLGAEFSKVLSENLVELSSEAKPEQAEAEQPVVVGYRSIESGMVYEQDYGLKNPEALTTVAECERIVRALRAEIAEWQEAAGRSRSDVVAYIAERAKLLEERDAALAEVERLTRDRDDCLKARLHYATQHGEALARVAELEKQEPVAWVEVIDRDYGPYNFHGKRLLPKGKHQLYASPVAQAQQLHDLDKQCRDDVARALGLRPSQERGFAWSYLLASIKSCVKASEDAAQAQHSVPAYVSYTTRPAESLAGIALRQLKEESRWVEIRDINAPAFPDMQSHSYYPAGTVIKLPAAAPGKEVPQAWLDVQAERRRQVEAEGWTPEHDDAHSHGQMARAAACYALAGSSAPNDGTAALLVSLAWPWDEQWWKPSTARRDMVKACALGLAEIERLDRAAATQGGPRDA
ncbi:LysM peptidoglycan-binding domain-containing protein [Pseudomonas aeruginosa]|uniref:LysM peptidoglycan-binding domain-containing protein n=1 Tax=Pseudomonas aeruginosa TaxID=287 RepID=UPI00053F27A8|nr:hypothetical protein [Pseudomonas aeruginosa]